MACRPSKTPIVFAYTPPRRCRRDAITRPLVTLAEIRHQPRSQNTVTHATRLVAQDAPLEAFGLGLSVPSSRPARNPALHRPRASVWVKTPLRPFRAGARVRDLGSRHGWGSVPLRYTTPVRYPVHHGRRVPGLATIREPPRGRRYAARIRSCEWSWSRAAGIVRVRLPSGARAPPVRVWS